MAATDASNEGRLSTGERLGRIEGKVDKILDEMGRLSTQSQLNRQRIDDHDSDLHDLIITIREEAKCRAEADVELEHRIDDVEIKSNTWDKINTGLATAAAIVGSIFGVKQ